jgi:hypothetical protein
MRAVCERVFKQHLKPSPNRQDAYFQSGKSMVVVESRQWKMAYSPLEKVTYDIADANAMVIEVPGDNGVHVVPWNMILRITVSENRGGF